MPRHAKLTSNLDDRKDQRDRTEQVKSLNSKLEPINLTAPAYLSGIAKEAYEELAGYLSSSGYVVQMDSSTIEALAMQIQIAQSAYESIQELGISYESNGRIFANPAVSQLDSATGKIKSLAGTLGMTPASRATIVPQTEDDGETTSAILNIFKVDN